MSALALLILLLSGFGALLAWAARRWQPNPQPLIEAIDALLPQTQCGQCGYPGCRPYAAAVAEGAALNLCPPGGERVHGALTQLLAAAPSTVPAGTPAQTARIDEAQCIGCFLCVQACPVDAIIGAPRYLHTVLQDQCTGCELCIDPCPVDCIELVARTTPSAGPPKSRRRWPDQPEHACIRCGQCQDVCPATLHPQQMLWFGDAASEELDRCIECGLCNQVCPSNIDLVGQFRRDRATLAAAHQATRDAEAAKARFENRQARQRAEHDARDARRRQRLAASRSWSP